MTDFKYLSFVGDIKTPNEKAIAELSAKYQVKTYEVVSGYTNEGEEVTAKESEGFRQGLKYKEIGGIESLSVYLAVVSNGIGHIVSRCSDWAEETFCMLGGDGLPIKATDRNPNPIEQASW